jgi:15-cis-phytoene desaturase
MDRSEAVVVGSGLAGMAAAYRLAKAGRRVLVLEAGPVLGGRTSSWVEDGMPVDSGLHKFLGIYRALPRLMRDVGVDPDAVLSWEDAVQIHVPDENVHAYFRAAPVHKPLRTLLTALGNNRIMPPRAKLALAYMGAGGLRECAAHPLELDKQNVDDYARRSGVSERVRRRLLAAVTQGVLFMPPESFSAYAVFAPVLEGLKNGLTFRVGAFTGGMTDVMIRPIADAVGRLGGRVRTGARVTRLAVESGRVVGVEVGPGAILADHVVLATALRPAQELIRAAFPLHPWFAPMLSLGTLSAVTVQMDLDGPALPSDHTNFSNGPLCCFAEQSRTTFTHAPGRLSVILYPPEEFLSLEPPAILERTVAEAKRLGIDLRGRVKGYRVVRHPHDFYALRPGSEALRPTQATPVPGLTLAGDYTKQPWVASMEGATVSGERAAGAVLAAARPSAVLGSA